MNTTVSQELLFDYFAGRVTALQRELIADWLRDSANEELFYRCLDEWERRKPQYIADLTDALPNYQTFLNRIPATPAQSPTASSSTSIPAPFQSIRRSWFGSTNLLAASVVLALTIGGWLFRDTLRYRIYATAYGETQSFTLADGSTVTLNANSSLRVSRFSRGWLGPTNRHVQLTGEANFSVRHTLDDQQFVVHTAKGLDVVVLGTEFTVFARPRETKVVLAKGKVLINYPTPTQKTAQLTLKPGDVVALDSRGQLKRATTPKPRDFAAWQQHQFIFNNTTLREVGQLLTDNYGIQVRIVGDGLARQTLTGSFRAQTADELLQAISDVMGINVARYDQQVVLTDNND